MPSCLIGRPRLAPFTREHSLPSTSSNDHASLVNRLELGEQRLSFGQAGHRYVVADLGVASPQALDLGRLVSLLDCPVGPFKHFNHHAVGRGSQDRSAVGNQAQLAKIWTMLAS